MLRVPVIAASVPAWIRDAAIAINGLLGRVDRLEAPQTDDVRYHAGVLEYWDGAAWQPVP